MNISSGGNKNNALDSQSIDKFSFLLSQKRLSYDVVGLFISKKGFGYGKNCPIRG
ncbi:hypothetical protein [Melghirimyces algeriensis]|uniref:hypothetical protein n=1 Tax=Melghirimyces algeriensis TaxID=910412 RepID=UPI00163D83CC|nr:hypothetical protein [Melghirimyces algeriensis]